MQRSVHARVHESNVGSLCSRATGGGNDEQQRARLTRASSVSHCMCIRCMDGRVSSVGGRIRCAMCTSFTWTHQRCCAHTEGRQEMQRGKVRGELHVHTLQKVDSMAARAMGLCMWTNFTVKDKADSDEVSDECDIWIDYCCTQATRRICRRMVIPAGRMIPPGWWYRHNEGDTRVRHQRRRPPSLKLTRSLQQAVVGTYTVQDCSVLHWALTALELSSNQPTVCTKAGRCSSKPISASTPLFTILFCPPCICLLARLTERFYK